MTRITMDTKRKGKSVRKVWNFGYNTCHGALLLRDDLYAHLKMSREAGFHYIRFHNILSEQVGIYREDTEGNPVYSFDNFDTIFDRILGCGLLPFLEISFCPPALKSGDTTITHYYANTSIPSSWEKWDELIRTLTRHIIDRYGLQCAKKWYFEVWNEPDLAFFEGEMEEYFTLYDHTVLAIKSVSAELRVGGPATSKCKWIDEFIHHVEKGSELTGYKPVPCDFIATHAYPSDLAFVDSDRGDVKLEHSNIMCTLFKEVRDRMDSSTLRRVPLIMGEWNSSAGPLAFNHDEKNNGAFIVKTLVELKDIIDGSLYWNLSDIYEECRFHYTPFHGGYGLLNVNSIPKSSFNAFKLLNRMEGAELAVEIDNPSESCGVLSTLDEKAGTLFILLYHYREPGTGEQGDWNVMIDVAGIQTESIGCKSTGINDNTGSAYEWWLKSGSPDYLTPGTMALLAEKARMEEQFGILFQDRDTGGYHLKEVLVPGDVKLLMLTL